MKMYKVLTPDPGKLLKIDNQGIWFGAWNIQEAKSVGGVSLMKVRFAPLEECGGATEKMLLAEPVFEGRRASSQPTVFWFRGKLWARAKRSRRAWKAALKLGSHYHSGGEDFVREMKSINPRWSGNATWVPYEKRLKNGVKTTLLYEV